MEIALDDDIEYELVANEADVALSAQLLVPNNDPVTPLPLKYSPLP